MSKVIQIETAILFRLAGSVKLTKPKWLKMRNGVVSGASSGSINLDGEADTESLAVGLA